MQFEKVDIVFAIGVLVFAGLCVCLIYTGESVLAGAFGIGACIAVLAMIEKLYTKR
jgi:hypothetical protein